MFEYLRAIEGPDPRDPTSVPVAPLPRKAPVKRLRVGYLKSRFEGDIPDNPASPERAQRARETRKIDQAALETLAALEGVALARYRLAFYGGWYLDLESVEHAFREGVKRLTPA